MFHSGVVACTAQTHARGSATVHVGCYRRRQQLLLNSQHINSSHRSTTVVHGLGRPKSWVASDWVEIFFWIFSGSGKFPKVLKLVVYYVCNLYQTTFSEFAVWCISSPDSHNVSAK